MPKPYSVDLRARVIEDVETGASRREAAERYGIGPSVVVIWVQRFEETGSVAAKPSGGSISPLEQHAEFLLGLIANQPDLTLDEIVAAMRKRRIAGSRSAVWRFFARRNISFKKTLYAAEQKRADVARARRRWMREQGMFDPAQLVFIDENLHEHCDGAAARPCSAWRAARRLRAAWTLENNHLCGQPAATRHDRTVCARRSHQRADVSRLCEAMPCPDPQARRNRADGPSAGPQDRRRCGGD